MNRFTSASAVANVFIELASSQRDKSLNLMKLESLMYYAQAWYLANMDTPLFENNIIACSWGPSINDIRNQLAGFKMDSINQLTVSIIKGTKGGYFIGTPSRPTSDIVDYIESIWSSHKGLSGIQLLNSTHAEGEPWTIVRNMYKTLDYVPVIPNSLIRDIYKEKVQLT